MSEKLYWHLYGGLMHHPEDNGDPELAVWASLLFGESTQETPALAEIQQSAMGYSGTLPHLHTWDYEPSEAEKDSFTPDKYKED